MRKLTYTIEIEDEKAIEALKVIEEDGMHGKSVIEDFVNACITDFIDDVILNNDNVCSECHAKEQQEKKDEIDAIKKWN